VLETSPPDAVAVTVTTTFVPVVAVETELVVDTDDTELLCARPAEVRNNAKTIPISTIFLFIRSSPLYALSSSSE
jgi:hypothetical protein